MIRTAVVEKVRENHKNGGPPIATFFAEAAEEKLSKREKK